MPNGAFDKTKPAGFIKIKRGGACENALPFFNKKEPKKQLLKRLFFGFYIMPDVGLYKLVVLIVRAMFSPSFRKFF